MVRVYAVYVYVMPCPSMLLTSFVTGVWEIRCPNRLQFSETVLWRLHGLLCSMTLLFPMLILDIRMHMLFVGGTSAMNRTKQSHHTMLYGN